MVEAMNPKQFEHSRRYGPLRGGLPVFIEKPNRAMRRAAAKEKGDTAVSPKQLMNKKSVTQKEY